MFSVSWFYFSAYSESVPIYCFLFCSSTKFTTFENFQAFSYKHHLYNQKLHFPKQHFVPLLNLSDELHGFHFVKTVIWLAMNYLHFQLQTPLLVLWISISKLLISYNRLYLLSQKLFLLHLFRNQIFFFFCKENHSKHIGIEHSRGSFLLNPMIHWSFRHRYIMFPYFVIIYFL